MPKITNQKMHRIHISIPNDEYQQILRLAENNKTSISEIFRTCINLITSADIPETPIVITPDIENLKTNLNHRRSPNQILEL